MAWTLVTGGAKRLGREICLHLAKEGHSIVVHYNQSDDEASQTQALCETLGVKAATIQGDFSTAKSMNEFLNRYKNLFGDTANVVNNVGNYLIKSVLKTDLQEWEALMQTNLLAPIALLQALIPGIKKHRGSIVNIGVAGLSRNKADTYSPAYTTTKMALLMLTQSLGVELAKDHVRVNMVSPGFLENSIDLPKDLTELPMREAVGLEEIARVIAFLMQPENRSITGQNIEIAGAVRL